MPSNGLAVGTKRATEVLSRNTRRKRANAFWQTGILVDVHPVLRTPPAALSITHISGHAEFKTDLDIC